MKKIYILMIAVLIGSIAKGQWQQTTQFGHPLGFEEFISYDSTIYASNGTQIYKTTNNGQVWDKMNLAVSSFEDYIDSYSVIDNSIITNGVGGHQGVTLVLRASFDNGNTWINYVDSFPHNFTPGKIRNFNDTLYLGTKFGIYFSINKGLNWNVFKNIDTCVSDLFIKGNNIYAVIYNDNDNGIKKSNDNGNTWIDISNGLPNNKYFQSICAIGNKLYLKVFNDSIYVSDNDGQSWKPMQYGLTTNYSFYNNPLTIYNDTVFYQDENSSYKASVNDTIWNELQLPYKGKYFVKDNLKFLGTSKGNFISSNYGNTWNPINNGIDKRTYISKIYKKNNDIYAATNEDGVFKTSDRGQTWIPLNNIYIKNDVINDLVIINSTLFIGTYHCGVLKSDNNGLTWDTINNGLYCLKINSISSKGSKLFAATDCGLFISNNYGQSWVQSSTGLIDTTIYSIAVEGNKIYAKTLNGLFVSENEGLNWNLINNSCEGNTLAVEGNKLFAGNYFTGVFSEDYGLSWAQTNDTTAYYLNIKTALIKSDLLILGGSIYSHKANVGRDYARLIISKNKGQTWTDSSSFFYYYYSNINSILELNDTLYVVSNITVWKRPLSDFVGINENLQNNKLSIYPNPATNTLSLNLSQLQKLQNANLSIYDIQGKLLLHQNISQAQTQIDISSFAKGIYIVKVQTDKESLQSKFVKE
jgi:hypothetical protein